MSPKTRAAISYLDANFQQRVRIDELARFVRLSRSRFCYLFKTEVGISPTQYLKKTRMKEARRFLETSLLSIKEIACEVAYPDSTHFMRDFKKVHGLTPSQYRCRILGTHHQPSRSAERKKSENG